MLTYGISDNEAAGVGLMCGGTVHIFVSLLDEASRAAIVAVSAAVKAGQPAALATLLDGSGAGARIAILPDGVVGSLHPGDLLDHAVERDARGLLAQGISTVRRYGANGEEMGSDIRVYVRTFQSPPEMIIFGAIDFSVAVADLARSLGYAVTLCDARRAFASSPRFSAVAEAVIDWPDRYLAARTLDERDVVLVFTHDSKFDEPALLAAVATGAGYIGALGSRRTQAERLARLRAAGMSEEDLRRIAAPCGFDIGARTPWDGGFGASRDHREAHRPQRRRIGPHRGPIHADRTVSVTR